MAFSAAAENGLREVSWILLINKIVHLIYMLYYLDQINANYLSIFITLIHGEHGCIHKDRGHKSPFYRFLFMHLFM